jgi:tRNA(fMet)-specific endonuclease VapC
MNLLFDTNILIFINRTKDEDKIRDFLNPNGNDIYISYTSIAEVESFALQNNWSKNKIHRFNHFIDEARTIQIDDVLLKTYVDIDAFSQRKHPNYTNYSFETPRNMGKHDLWIAATASILNLTLVTTDKDFDHLNEEFLKVRFINPIEIRKYLL